jgi:hypothetical protein
MVGLGGTPLKGTKKPRAGEGAGLVGEHLAA